MNTLNINNEYKLYLLNKMRVNDMNRWSKTKILSHGHTTHGKYNFTLQLETLMSDKNICNDLKDYYNKLDYLSWNSKYSKFC